MTTWRERRQKVEEEVFGGEDVNWSGRGEAIMHSVNWHPFPKVGGWLGSDFEKQAGEIGCGQGWQGWQGSHDGDGPLNEFLGRLLVARGRARARVLKIPWQRTLRNIYI
jgi:hypothetical protein